MVVEVTLNRPAYSSQRSDEPENVNFEPLKRGLRSDINSAIPKYKYDHATDCWFVGNRMNKTDPSRRIRHHLIQHTDSEIICKLCDIKLLKTGNVIFIGPFSWVCQEREETVIMEAHILT